MGVQITTADPSDPPIEMVTITDGSDTREIRVRRTSEERDPNLRTFEITHYGPREVRVVKFVQTLDNVEKFGQALVRMAQQGRVGA